MDTLVRPIPDIFGQWCAGLSWLVFAVVVGLLLLAIAIEFVAWIKFKLFYRGQ